MENKDKCRCNKCPFIESKKEKQKLEWSKKLIADVRVLLWIVTCGGLILAAMCIHKGYIGSLPWLSAMVGLPWTAHGVICSCYLNMAKSDHRVGGITYEKAKANNFNNNLTTSYIRTTTTNNNSRNSPSI